MSVNVILPGPAPWGFRITGGRDFRKAIMVSKVTEHSKAARGGLQPGDIIVSINGEKTSEMLNVEAQNKIKQSSGQLQLQVDRSQQIPPSQTNGESSPEMLSIRFQGAMRTRDDGQSSLRSSISSPASISPRPSSPYSLPSPGYRSGSPYSPQRTTLPYEGRGEFMMNSRSFQSLGSSMGISGEQSPPLQGQQRSSRGQERRSFSHSGGSPVTVLPPLNGSSSVGAYSPSSPWKDQDRSASFYNRSYSLDSEPAMHHLEGDSEVYKMMQENRETRAPPRQSSTFRMLQMALEMDEKEGTVTQFPSQLSPSPNKPVSSCTASNNSQKLHVCEKCGSSIVNQAVRIQENRYRHPACYVCTDCGLNLKMRGHFWVGEEMFCEKHARQRYQEPAGSSTVTAVYSQS